MNSSFRRRGTRRGILFFSVAFAASVAIGARPAAPGVSFRLRMVMTPPDMPGMVMQPMTIVGHGIAIGAQSRIDIDSVVGQIPMTVGDYMLSLDSGRMVTVSPSTKSYTEGAAGLAAMSSQMMAQASITDVNVTTEKLGAGEAIQGFPTQKFRLTTTYVLGIMGQSMNTMTVAEMSMAQLPASVTTPFDGGVPKEMMDGPMKDLYAKTAEARKALGGLTPLKTVTTSTITSAMLPQPINTVITVEMLDVKAGDVDAAMLKIPEGFAKKP